MQSCKNSLVRADSFYRAANNLYDKQEYSQALELYREAAELGKPEALNDIGLMYQKGQGVHKDYMIAMLWFKKGAKAGNSAAMSNIGWLYDKGYGVKEDDQ